MNWTECTRLEMALGLRDRFTFPPDVAQMNCEPGLTISDVTGTLMWGLTLPGDAILGYEPIRTFLELEAPVVGYWVAIPLGLIAAALALQIGLFLTVVPFMAMCDRIALFLDQRAARRRNRR